jgi:flavin reductase (DIM6/NTAB) family NADH-FMN oxidoreductase RutF
MTTQAAASEETIQSAFSGRDFRNAVGMFATGVTVITTAGETHGYGMTVNAFSTVSLDPPLVLVCTIAGAAGSEHIERNGCFAVNVLAHDQEPLSGYFASRERPKGRDAFRDVDHKIGASGAPLIDGVMAHLDCKVHEHYVAGDHDIFIGEVLDIYVNPETKPLLFHGGKYRFLQELA